ncbi:Protein-tyrosine-phosphatase MKP1 [Linum perenne]
MTLFTRPSGFRTTHINSILYDVFDYFEDVREQGVKVLVHCCQGVSRSNSLVIAYLMWREGQSFEDAFQYVKAARGVTNPNMGFACQLLQCQKRVHVVPLMCEIQLTTIKVVFHEGSLKRYYSHGSWTVYSFKRSFSLKRK